MNSYYIVMAYSGSYNFNYIAIPLITNFELGNKVRYFGYTGLYLGLLTQATNYTTLSTTSQPDLTPYDLSYNPTDVLNDYEFGGLIGVGTKIPLLIFVIILD